MYILLYGCELSALDVLEALNGSMVGLGYVPQGVSSSSAVRVVYMSDDAGRLVHCLGLGLVRGVDKSKGELHLLSPINMLSGVNCVMLSAGMSAVSGLMAGGGCAAPIYLSALSTGRLLSGQCARRNLLRGTR